MPTTISKLDLFRAVLEMDVYHRGYNGWLGTSMRKNPSKTFTYELRKLTILLATLFIAVVSPLRVSANDKSEILTFQFQNLKFYVPRRMDMMRSVRGSTTSALLRTGQSINLQPFVPLRTNKSGSTKHLETKFPFQVDYSFFKSNHDRNRYQLDGKKFWTHNIKATVTNIDQTKNKHSTAPKQHLLVIDDRLSPLCKRQSGFSCQESFMLRFASGVFAKVQYNFPARVPKRDRTSIKHDAIALLFWLMTDPRERISLRRLIDTQITPIGAEK